MICQVIRRILSTEFILKTNYPTPYYVAKNRLQLIRLSARLGDVLTDESVEDEFSHMIR